MVTKAESIFLGTKLEITYVPISDLLVLYRLDDELSLKRRNKKLSDDYIFINKRLRKSYDVKMKRQIVEFGLRSPKPKIDLTRVYELKHFSFIDKINISNIEIIYI